jgi:hypothetical protein
LVPTLGSTQQFDPVNLSSLVKTADLKTNPEEEEEEEEEENVYIFIEIHIDMLFI